MFKFFKKLWHKFWNWWFNEIPIEWFMWFFVALGFGSFILAIM